MTVYIPTMSRPDNLRRVVPYWLAQEMNVYLVVEPGEYEAHLKLRDDMDWPVSVLRTKAAGAGIGYVRRFCVGHAKHRGLPSFIMADDDIRPANGSDMRQLTAAAARPGVLGVGAVRGIHDRFTQGAISAHSGLMLCPGGWAFQLFALNVANAIAAGNFDPALHSLGEDAELARNGIVRLRMPWLVHCDVWCTPVGKRYEPGGISARYASREARTEGERDCMRVIHERWPAYANLPDRPLRFAWQRFLTDKLPEWRRMSAMHGGRLPRSILRGS